MSQSKFFELVSSLDIVLREMPTQDNVTEFIRLIKIDNEALRKYAFDHLDNPKWINELYLKGCFSSPASIVRDEVQGTISFKSWPESQYLARMSSKDTQSVLGVMLEIPETDNINVHVDLADAALAMPAKLAIPWVEKEVKWLSGQNYLYLLPEKLGELITHLAKGSEGETAFALAEELLKILPDPESQKKLQERKSWVWLQPRARFEAWYYERILKKHLPALADIDGLRTLDLQCRLLASAISLSHENEDVSQDHSDVWRPTIEYNKQHLSEDLSIKNMLVTSIRDLSERILKTSPEKFSDVVKVITNTPRRWDIYERLAMHLLCVIPDPPSDLIREYLVNERLHKSFSHEYVRLSKTSFGNISKQDQEKILDRIMKANEKDRWKWRRLTPLRDHLRTSDKEFYDIQAKKYGIPERPEEIFISRTWVGPTSSKTADEMKTMDSEDVLKHLETWIPPDDPRSPSKEGLGREFQQVVESEPEKYAPKSDRFQKLDPTYVRAFLAGLENAVKQKRSFSWPPVLELCRWVTTQERDIPGRKKSYDLDEDPNWGWTRKTMADLMAVGAEDDALWYIPFDLHKEVWKIIEFLTRDPEPEDKPELEYEAQRDAATLALNTVRGSAMHAVVRYALWIRRHLEKEPDAKERLSRGFDEMPEVRKVLEERLDMNTEKSTAVRSVFGQWFPWLGMLGEEWVKQNVSKIFPQEESLQHLWGAAWDTYVVFCEPYDKVFPILRDQYARAIDRIGTSTPKKVRVGDPDERLAEHLVILYARGKLSLDDDLLKRFYEKASDHLRWRALSTLGGALGTEKKISSEALARMWTLWEHRLAANRGKWPSAELGAFGSWFVSGKYPDEKTLPQLIEAAKISGRLDFDTEVLEKLGRLVETMPQPVIECLQALVESNKDNWHIPVWRKPMHPILDGAIRGKDAQARESAIDLVHRLGALGFLDYRDLLSQGKH